MSYDRSKLQRMLRNEADMAAKRRVEVVLEYLDIQPGEMVLDCGCGLGWFLEIISELFDCTLHGIDRDADRLRRAQQEVQGATNRSQTRSSAQVTSRESRHEHLAITTSDITNLPFADNTFDKIVLSEVLEHLPDDLAGLLEVRRVLKPGGVIAITVPNHDYPLLWDPINWSLERMRLAPIRSGFWGGLWANHVRLYYRDDLVTLLRRADLQVEDVRQFVHHCFPFTHNLVYGLGKMLVESHMLTRADRFRYAENSGSLLNPLNLALWTLNKIDGFNDPVSDERKSTVIISLKARKPRDEVSAYN